MDDIIETIIKRKNIAVVGASSSPRKFGHIVYKDLKAKGYCVYPVNPHTESVDGDKCYPDLDALPDDIDTAVVITSPENALKIVEDAKTKGIKHLWFQRGAESALAVKKAEENGVAMVTQKCIMMYTSPVKGAHSVHRFFSKVFGKY